MTLILKELIVRGIVTSGESPITESSFDKESMVQLVEKIKKEVEKECIEKVIHRLESKTKR